MISEGSFANNFTVPSEGESLTIAFRDDHNTEEKKLSYQSPLNTDIVTQ